MIPLALFGSLFLFSGTILALLINVFLTFFVGFFVLKFVIIPLKNRVIEKAADRDAERADINSDFE